MKNYFKTYYKTRISQGVLGEQASDLKQQLATEALAKHKNIMEGYNPGGRDSGIMNPEDRAKYIKHFTNFIKESYFNDLEVNWTKARDAHNHMIEEDGYVSAFTDFMNSPTTNIILEKSILTEEAQKHSPFVNDVIEAIKKHVKNPYQTVGVRHKGDFVDQIDDVFDTWIPTSGYIEAHLNDPKAKEAPLWVQAGHDRRIDNLRHLLGKENADNLLKKHFPEHHK